MFCGFFVGNGGVGIFLWLILAPGVGETDISVIFCWFGGERRQGYFRDCGLCRGAKVKAWKESSMEV